MKIENRNIWFCSDPHYSHRNICRGGFQVGLVEITQGILRTWTK